MLNRIYQSEFHNIVLFTLWFAAVIVLGKIVKYQINRVL